MVEEMDECMDGYMYGMYLWMDGWMNDGIYRLRDTFMIE